MRYPDGPATFYVYKLTHDTGKYIGYGIASYFDKRVIQHKILFEKHKVSAELVCVRECTSRALAKLLEDKLKKKFRSGGLDIPSFKTESLPKDKWESFVRIVTRFNFNRKLRVKKVKSVPYCHDLEWNDLRSMFAHGPVEAGTDEFMEASLICYSLEWRLCYGNPKDYGRLKSVL